MLIICCIDLIIVDFVSFLIISAVPKCIAHDMVIIIDKHDINGFGDVTVFRKGFIWQIVK
jgi:hypothetical protein